MVKTKLNQDQIVNKEQKRKVKLVDPNHQLKIKKVVEIKKRKKVKRKNQLHLMQKHLVNLIKYKLFHNIKKF